MENIRDIIRENCQRLLEREVSGLSLREIARQTGVSEATIQRWKTGVNSPELNNIEKLAEVLKISPREFFEVKSPEDTETSKDQSLEIIQQIASLGPSELEILMDTLKALSKPLPAKAQKKNHA